ncbi:MAG: hypothetical protein ACO3DP_01395 [Candidatus Nanopelagicaceae bacterium]
MKHVVKNLTQKHIIKSIVQMNAAELLQIKESWISIMKEKQFEMERQGHVKNVKVSLADIINLIYVLFVKNQLALKIEKKY